MLLLTKSKILCAKASASETLLSRPLVGRAVTYTFIRNFVPVLTPLRGVTGTEELSLSLLRSKSGPFGGTRNFVPVRRKCTVRTPFLLKLEVRSSYRRAKPPSGVTGTEFRVKAILAERSSVGNPPLGGSLEFDTFSLMRSRTKCSAKRKFGLNSPSALCTALRATSFGYGLLYY